MKVFAYCERRAKATRTRLTFLSVPLILASYRLQPNRTGLGCLYFISNIESITLNESPCTVSEKGLFYGLKKGDLTVQNSQ